VSDIASYKTRPVSDVLQIGAYVRQSTCIVGFAALAGTPVAGALINNHSYTRGIIFSAAVIMAGAVLITCARYFFAKNRVIA